MTSTHHSLLRRILTILTALAVLAAAACQSPSPTASATAVPLLPANPLVAGDRLGLQIHSSSPAPDVSSSVLSSADLRNALFW